MPTLAQYLSLVTPQHRNAPRFMAALATLLQPFVDQQALLGSLPDAFDLDDAVGAQLDAVGLWIGETRFLKTPLAGAFFSFDDPKLGWGAGHWKGPFDATTGLARLDDDTFRTLLRAKIAANHWDGTLAGAAAALAYIYRDPATRVFIQDNQDETISFNVAGQPLSAVDLALLTGGYIPLKPAGVSLSYVNLVSVIGAPLFGFDLENSNVSGFDVGAWGSSIAPAQGTTGGTTSAGGSSVSGSDTTPLTGSDGTGLTGSDGADLSGAVSGVSSSTGSGSGGTTPATGSGAGTGAGTATTPPSFSFDTTSAILAGFDSGVWTGTAPASSGTTGSTDGTTSPTPGGAGSTPTGPAGGSGSTPPDSGSSTGTGSTTPAGGITTTPTDGGTGFGSGTGSGSGTGTTPATGTTSAAPPPTFGFGVANSDVAGFDTGVWTRAAA